MTSHFNASHFFIIVFLIEMTIGHICGCGTKKIAKRGRVKIHVSCSNTYNVFT